MTGKRKILAAILGVALLACACYAAYDYLFAPTRILVVNPLPQQAADIVLSNDSRHIEIDTQSKEEVHGFSNYDAVMMYGRGLYLDDEQMEELERAASGGTLVFTDVIRNNGLTIQRNIDTLQVATLQTYFANANRGNYRNALLYLRHITTPHRLGDQQYEQPVLMPDNMFYHREYGRYFTSAAELTDYLKEKGIYNDGGKTIGMLAGVAFPAEGNRLYLDTLITQLTTLGYNVYPFVGTGKGRERLFRQLHPDALIYFPMGRLGNDSLVSWVHSQNIMLFTPYPLSQNHDEWLDVDNPITGGSLTARIVIPEIDGGVGSYALSTQNENEEGYYVRNVEAERVDAFIRLFTNYMKLRDMDNSDKRIAICYFKNPGKDALLASGMEVVPSLYNFLKHLRSEGYDVSGLPATEKEFEQRILRDGAVLGSYAKGSQDEFLKHAHPVWLTTQQYEEWAHQVILPEKYREVTEHYGDAPGNLLATGDSIAVACLQFGNVLLFPQPRPALGDDEFKLVHGSPVAPPHSYLAPYLYMQKGFKADALIHFGTHGNLEYTPGKNAALSAADWSEALVGNLPHFYLYTTGNVGESIIAKRRTHAAIVTHLTPPYVESGMRQRYSALLDDVHKAIDAGSGASTALGIRIKDEVLKLGLHRNLDLDSVPGKPYTLEELEKLDAFAEEIANEKTTGAYYTLGQPYSERDLRTTVLAIYADQLAYETARRDRDAGKITTDELQDYTEIAHHYLPQAKQRIRSVLEHVPADTASVAADLRPAVAYYRLLKQSSVNEVNVLTNALSGQNIFPAPGGDPVLNPNVLPTGRNMYSINAENTPNERAWEDGRRLADVTLQQYVQKHGEYPHKVSYTFWAGEFINTEGATIAQALWMLGTEPVRDVQGRVVDLRLVPEEELGRPRVNVMVQVSGQLRDIAGSRLKLITEAVKLASGAPAEKYPNYVSEGTTWQEKELVEKGMSPAEAREMSVMRVFGPVNSGYSTGMLGYTESSGSWDDTKELVDGYLNNMGAMYGDDDHWGSFSRDIFASAMQQTDVVIQPRQSNTWGPVSLDHVYEFTGGLSLAVKTLTGKEPDAYMADYRNRSNRRMQEAKEAVGVETRATVLNPTFVQERMKGGAGAAQSFGETFRNIFGWHVMRPSVMDKEIYNDLYRMYIADENNLGVYQWFSETNPAAFQSMTAVMLESARKGYWTPSDVQLKAVAEQHARMTEEHSAACTEFVCGNRKLQGFVAQQLSGETRDRYDATMKQVYEAASGNSNGKEMVLKQQTLSESQTAERLVHNVPIALGVVAIVVLVIILIRRRKEQ